MAVRLGDSCPFSAIRCIFHGADCLFCSLPAVSLTNALLRRQGVAFCAKPNVQSELDHWSTINTHRLDAVLYFLGAFPPFHCLAAPFHRLLHCLSSALHCPFTAFPCPSTALPLPVHCPFRCPFTAFRDSTEGPPGEAPALQAPGAGPADQEIKLYLLPALGVQLTVQLTVGRF